jgi:hypothetical protein
MRPSMSKQYHDAVLQKAEEADRHLISTIADLVALTKATGGVTKRRGHPVRTDVDD